MHGIVHPCPCTEGPGHPLLLQQLALVKYERRQESPVNVCDKRKATHLVASEEPERRPEKRQLLQFRLGFVKIVLSHRGKAGGHAAGIVS